MTNEPIRIAQMMTDMNFGGVEMVVMNYYRNIDRTKVQFDFIVLEGSTIPQREEIEALGGRIYIVPRYTHLIQYEKAIQKIFKENDYKIVHSHMNTLGIFSLYGAKKAGVPVRILHNHSTAGKGETKKNIIKYILRPFAKIYPTHLCACSKYAGEWVYGKNTEFKVFNNAIDLDKFKYNEVVRNELRKELDIEKKFVIGHIGRFCYQKNHKFLVNIFNEVTKINENAVLILIGEGELEEEVKEQVKQLNLQRKVLFLGKKADAYRYYQAMDLLLLPSRYEGLPVVGIEAQAASLPIICSTEVTKETKITNLVEFLDLKAPINEWAEKVKSISRKDVSEEIKKASYDIKTEGEKLLHYYEGLLK
ncbi:glycosyltransferase family 1 protein [Dubosiella newyorkensis]|uniref:glycosyltransferase family 1 protein n=2 Tax=Dubosiella newyorkensis TaxID=1862672 RepID=UPI00248B725B|nr:glycosyltransferase family 1 protein [Dubosiella newyorkensis]